MTSRSDRGSDMSPAEFCASVRDLAIANRLRLAATLLEDGAAFLASAVAEQAVADLGLELMARAPIAGLVKGDDAGPVPAEREA